MVRPARGRALLVTTDQLIEGIHFQWSWSDATQLGYRAGAVTLSDIAAMGGVPRYVLLSLGIPPRTTVDIVSRFCRGLRALLSRHRVHLIGGDTAAAPQFHAVMTAIGDIEPNGAVSRSGARPGDLIMVTGTLGDAAAGLHLLQTTAGRRVGVRTRTRRASPKARSVGEQRLIRRQLYPTPRLHAGRAVARHRLATAMLDLSDGLTIDLDRLCRASGVGATVISEQLPLSPELMAYGRRARLDPIQIALAGGEDYELLFTVRPARADRCAQVFRRLRLNCCCIGRIERRAAGPRVTVMRGGRRRAAGRFRGYEHFRAPMMPRI